MPHVFKYSNIKVSKRLTISKIKCTHSEVYKLLNVCVYLCYDTLPTKIFFNEWICISFWLWIVDCIQFQNIVLKHPPYFRQVFFFHLTIIYSRKKCTLLLFFINFATVQHTIADFRPKTLTQWEVFIDTKVVFEVLMLHLFLLLFFERLEEFIRNAFLGISCFKTLMLASRLIVLGTPI